MSASIVLAAHGSNARPQVNERVCQLAGELEAGSTFGRVVAAFHQGEPYFSEVLDQLPVGPVIVIPFMTSDGYYCDTVLPRELRKNLSFNTDTVRMTPPVGSHSKMRMILAHRLDELIRAYDLRASKLAVLVVGHGTPRHTASRDTTIRLARALKIEFDGTKILPAFIDDEPSVLSSVESIEHLDCVVLPFFMSAGMHTIEDLPRMLGFTQELDDVPLVKRDAGRKTVLDRPVGLDDGMFEIINDLAHWTPTARVRRSRKQQSIRLGTRSSKMAIWQATHVASVLPSEYRVDVVEISTMGDRDRTQPIDALPSDAPFTDDIETALIEGRIDVAIHSLKDLPLGESPQTKVAAILPRGDARECIVTHDRVSLMKLPRGATVGTSCARRALQVLRLRPDVQIVSLRGPVDDRVQQVRDGRMAAAILAWVGLQRLDLLDAVDEVFDLEQFLPAPGQAALAVQVRADDQRMFNIVSPFDEAKTRAETTLELDLQRAIEPDSDLTVAAYARHCENRFHLHARIMSKVAKRTLDLTESGESADAVLESVLSKLNRTGLGVATEFVH